MDSIGNRPVPKAAAPLAAADMGTELGRCLLKLQRLQRKGAQLSEELDDLAYLVTQVVVKMNGAPGQAWREPTCFVIHSSADGNAWLDLGSAKIPLTPTLLQLVLFLCRPDASNAYWLPPRHLAELTDWYAEQHRLDRKKFRRQIQHAVRNLLSRLKALLTRHGFRLLQSELGNRYVITIPRELVHYQKGLERA